MSIGQKIKIFRKDTGLTQIELAKRAGVGVRFIHELEHDKPALRLDKVYVVLRFFGKKLEVIDDADCGE